MAKKSRVANSRCRAAGRSAVRGGLVLLAVLVVVLAAPARAQNYPLPENRTILVRGDYDYPPYEFIRNGKPRGYNVEMLRAVARTMDLHIEIRLGPWNEARRDLEQGRADVLAGMYRSEERDKRVDFSEPHVIVHHSLFVHKASAVESLDDLEGRALVVQDGDIMHDYARREALADRIVAVETPLDALTLVNSGNYECALLGRLQGIYLARREGLDSVEAVGPSLMPREYCFAVRENDRELLARLNEGLRVLSATGEADKIYDRWFGPASGTAHPWQALLPYFAAAAALALLALVVTIVWSRTLSRRVKSATARMEEELRERRRAEMALARHRDNLEELVEERTRELREANERMLEQQRLATLGQLTATVSHELRNPLGTIRNSAYSIREHLRRTGDTTPEPALDRIERSLLRCNSIIRELLEYTSVRHLSLTLIELDPWLERMVAELIAPPGIDLRTEFHSGAYVMVDTERFRRVVLNLVDNAMQAITGTRIHPDRAAGHEGEVVIASLATDERVMVQVSDNGPGMVPEVAEQVFEPLFTTKSYGVGLGLPIVLQLMHLHDGDVELQTQPGQGATFTVWLPRAEPPETD